jgi:DHA2 family methylenomycin A resistance protein-like MFS transporter
VDNPLVLGSFAVAAIAVMLFIFIEAKSASPMLPLSLLRDATFSSTVLFGICVNMAYYGIIFVLSLFLQRAEGDTPLQAGLAFLPLTGGLLVSNIASGWVVARHGPRLPMMVGAAVAAIGYAMLHAVHAQSSYAALVVPFLLIPLGMGLAVPAMTTAILASVKANRAGTASAVLNTARQAGGAVGVAAFGALASGAGPQAVVGGLQSSAAVAAVLLAIGAMLACRVHPQSHAPAHERAADTQERSPSTR